MIALLNPQVAEVYEATVDTDVKLVTNQYNGKLSLLPPIAAAAAEKAGLIKKKLSTPISTPKRGKADAPTADEA